MQGWATSTALSNRRSRRREGPHSGRPDCGHGHGRAIRRDANQFRRRRCAPVRRQAAARRRENQGRPRDSRSRDEERAPFGRPRSSTDRAAAVDAPRYVAIIVQKARLLGLRARRARAMCALAIEHRDWSSSRTPCHCFSDAGFAKSRRLSAVSPRPKRSALVPSQSGCACQRAWEAIQAPEVSSTRRGLGASALRKTAWQAKISTNRSPGGAWPEAGGPGPWPGIE